jgi:hypothetical protein
MSNLTTQTTTAIAIPEGLRGFTQEEILGGMNPIVEGYRKSYKYFLSRPGTLGKFQVIENSTEKVIWEGDKIEGAVIYYAHDIMRLRRGHIEAPDKPERDFTEDEKTLLAITYDPLKSRGSFDSKYDSNGYSKYLTSEFKDLHRKMKRLYVIMLLPKSFGTGAEPVLASFSITTNKTFNALRKTTEMYGLPLPLFKTNIFFTEAKSENKEDYLRIDFGIVKDAKGGPVFTFDSRDKYVSSPYGAKLLNDIKETHEGAVRNAERSSFGGSSIAVESSSPGISTFTELVETVKDEFKGTEVDPNEMPF